MTKAVHPNDAINRFITLPYNAGNEFRIPVLSVLSTSMIIKEPSYEIPPMFRLVYTLVTRNLDGYLYKFIGAET